MKKIFLLISTATAMISFAGCQKNEMETPNVNEESSTFELVADIAQTKTTLDGLNLDWEDGDIIYMVTSDGTWGKPYAEDNTTKTIAEFTYSGGKFTTVSTIESGDYTFKAVYSNGKQMSYHRSDVTTNQLYALQTQDCENPTAHVKVNDALVGTFKATVPMNEAAQMIMSHLYTMMQVDVKNNTGATIEVTEFQMTAAGADLAGIFTVTAFDTPAISIKSEASETITVNVANGAVATGESLPIYFIMAPLANYSGDVTFKVTDSEGNTYTKTVALNNISFAAGKYNTTPYTISEADYVEPKPETVEATLSFDDTVNRTEFSTQKQVWEQNSIILINDKANSTSNVADYSNPARFYKNSTITIKAPGKITKMIFNCKEGGDELRSIIAGAQGNDTKVTIELDGTSSSVTYKLSDGKVFVYSIVVYYVNNSSEGGEEPEIPVEPALTPRDLAFDPNTVTATIGEPFTAPTLKGYTEGVTYSSSTTSVATVDASTGLITLIASGTTTITASAPATNQYAAGNATYTLIVSVAQGGEEGGETPSVKKFVKVTSEPTDWSGTYLIVYEDGNVAFDGNRTTMDAASNTISVTISNGVIAHTSNLEASTFVIAKSGSNYTVKSASGYYVGQTSNANGLKSNKTTSYNHTISMADANVNLVSGGAYLRYNSASDQKRFRYYKSSSYTGQKAIQLYKLEE